MQATDRHTTSTAAAGFIVRTECIFANFAKPLRPSRSRSYPHKTQAKIGKRWALWLRCTLSRMGALGTRNLYRERFAIRPNRPIFKVFLLPDGHRSLERVDKPTASIECGRTVRRGNHNCYASLANFHPPD